MVPEKQTNKVHFGVIIQMTKRNCREKLQENFWGTSICSIMGPYLCTYKDWHTIYTHTDIHNIFFLPSKRIILKGWTP